MSQANAGCWDPRLEKHPLSSHHWTGSSFDDGTIHLRFNAVRNHRFINEQNGCGRHSAWKRITRPVDRVGFFPFSDWRRSDDDLVTDSRFARPVHADDSGNTTCRVTTACREPRENEESCEDHLAQNRMPVVSR